MWTTFPNNKKTDWEIVFFPVTTFRHLFTNSCFSMTVAPSESVRLGMRRGFRLCSPRSWALSQKHPLLETGRDKVRGHHRDLGWFCSQAGHICVWTTVALKQHKSWLIWCRKALPPASLCREPLRSRRTSFGSWTFIIIVFSLARRVAGK